MLRVRYAPASHVLQPATMKPVCWGQVAHSCRLPCANSQAQCAGRSQEPVLGQPVSSAYPPIQPQAPVPSGTQYTLQPY